MTRLADTITTIHPLDRVAQAAAAERQSRLKDIEAELSRLQQLRARAAAVRK